MSDQVPEPEEPGSPETAYRDIEIRQVESRSYRNISMSGASGGLVQTGDIFVSLYVDRPALPDRLGLRIYEDGTSKPVHEMTSGGNALVREIEVGVFMSLNTAEALGAWLLDKVAQYRDMIEDVQRESMEEHPSVPEVE